MNSTTKIWFFFLVVLLLGGYASYEYFFNQQPDQQLEIVKIRPTAVCCTPIELETYSQTLRLDGRIQAKYRADLGFQIMGRIAQLGIKKEGQIIPLVEGMAIKQGQILAVLDTQLLQAMVEQAESDIQSARANIDAANAQISVAQTDYNDKQHLHKLELRIQDKNVNSNRKLELAKRDMDTSRALLKKAEAALLMAKAQYQSAGVKLTLAKINLQYATLRSPVDGLVSAVHGEVGQLAGINQSIVSVVAQDTVDLILGVPESKITRLKIGQVATIELQSLSQKLTQASLQKTQIQKILGTITVIPPAIDKVTGLFHVEIKIPNPHNRLKPGMIGTARINLDNNIRAYKIPLAAIFVTDKQTWGYFAMKVKDKLIAKRVEFTQGIIDDQYLLLEKLPIDSDLLITQGQNRVSDGKLIRQTKSKNKKITTTLKLKK